MGLLDVLRKRHDDKQMSHADYVAKAVQAEASGNAKGIDISRLEGSMAAIGMDFSTFEAAVERERRVTELRGVASGLADAEVRFKDLAQHAKARQAAGEEEISAIRKEVAEAELAASLSRSELDRCKQADLELRRLLESPARKQARLDTKPVLAGLRQRKRDLEEEIIGIESAIKNIDVRSFTFAAERDRHLADREEKLTRTQAKLAKITQQLAEAEAAEKQAAQELDQQVAAAG